MQPFKWSCCCGGSMSYKSDYRAAAHWSKVNVEMRQQENTSQVYLQFYYLSTLTWYYFTKHAHRYGWMVEVSYDNGRFFWSVIHWSVLPLKPNVTQHVWLNLCLFSTQKPHMTPLLDELVYMYTHSNTADGKWDDSRHGYIHSSLCIRGFSVRNAIGERTVQSSTRKETIAHVMHIKA